MSYREELIQSAAVIVSMLEDLDSGIADASRSLTADWPSTKQSKRTQPAPILKQIFEERLKQDAKWGPQHHNPELWLTILMEEVGEAAQAYLHDIEGEYSL